MTRAPQSGLLLNLLGLHVGVNLTSLKLDLNNAFKNPYNYFNSA